MEQKFDRIDDFDKKFNENNEIQQGQMQNQNQNSMNTRNGICKYMLHKKSCINGSKCQGSHDIAKAKRCHKGPSCPNGDNCDFSHQLLCKEFAKFGDIIQGGCLKGSSCPNTHAFPICPYFESGFCPYGRNCDRKHIFYKLCENYMSGYCDKGPTCESKHPQNFILEDFAYQTFKKEQVLQCISCEYMGHKRDNCIFQQEFTHNKVVLCGLCNQKHTITNVCEKWRKIEAIKNQDKIKSLNQS